MDDNAILDLYWQRDTRALDETGARYGAYCHRIAYNILQSPEDAEESVNDTWLHAWNAIPPERPRVLGLWLGRVTRNLSLSRLRKRMAQRRGGGEAALALEELSECLSGADSVEGEVEARELALAVRRFLDGLGQAERDVLLSRYYYLAPLAEISQRSGCSVSKLKSMLHRSRRKLKQYLSEEGYL